MSEPAELKRKPITTLSGRACGYSISADVRCIGDSGPIGLGIRKRQMRSKRKGNIFSSLRASSFAVKRWREQDPRFGCFEPNCSRCAASKSDAANTVFESCAGILLLAREVRSNDPKMEGNIHGNQLSSVL